MKDRRKAGNGSKWQRKSAEDHDGRVDVEEHSYIAAHEDERAEDDCPCQQA
jgi:hypothetical protein